MADFTWNSDRRPSKRVSIKVDEASFGDNYSQRVTSGINIVNQTWTLNFTNRTTAEVDAIETFLEGKAGAVAFTWVVPLTSTTIKVTCKEWNRIDITPGISTISCTFNREYE